jgi:hypothetical protein
MLVSLKHITSLFNWNINSERHTSMWNVKCRATYHVWFENWVGLCTTLRRAACGLQAMGLTYVQYKKLLSILFYWIQQDRCFLLSPFDTWTQTSIFLLKCWDLIIMKKKKTIPFNWVGDVWQCYITWKV